MHKELEELGVEEWKWAELETRFFGPGVAVNASVTEAMPAG